MPVRASRDIEWRQSRIGESGQQMERMPRDNQDETAACRTQDTTRWVSSESIG